MSRRRPLRVAGWWIAAVLTAQLALAGAASAHDELLTSVPADGATVTALPAAVTLVFAEPPGPGFTTVTVSGPTGQRMDSGRPRVTGSRISEIISSRNTPGRYSINFRIMSDDGHPVSGQLHFTLAPRPAVESGAAARSAVSAGAAPRRAGRPAPLASVAAGVVLLVVVLAGAGLRASRLRSRAPAGSPRPDPELPAR
jgi:copper resistance protein C